MIINATHIGEKLDGIGRFSLKIAKFFLQKHQVIINENAAVHFTDEELKNLKIVSNTISPDFGFKGHLKRLIFTNTLNGDILNLSQLEINFWNENQIIVVHDIIPLLFPQYHKKQYHFFKYILPFVLKNKTKKIITVSNHTKDLLIKFYNIDSKKIEVIYNGVDVKFDKDIRKENIIFFVGRNSPTKNIKNIINSFRKLKKDKRFNSYKLVLGGVGNLSLNSQDIIVKNYLNEEELKFYYKVSKVFLFPTLYEGFGFPVIEAMRAKTACIISNRGSLPEIANNCAIIVNPLNVTEITDSLKELLLNEILRKKLEIKGYQNSLKFDWKNSLKKYERILNENSFSS